MESCFERRKVSKKSHPNIISDCLIIYKPLCIMVKVMEQHMKKGKVERNVAKGYINLGGLRAVSCCPGIYHKGDFPCQNTV